MTAPERHDLLTLARSRARVARAQVAQRAAELEADIEKQLAAEYSWDTDATWKEAYAKAAEATRTANVTIADRCRELGIPNDFAPQLSEPYWWPRRENASAVRRGELRKVARSRIDALAKQAIAAIEATSVQVQEHIITDGLTTTEARRFVAGMPTPADLMPPIALSALSEGPLTPRAPADAGRGEAPV